MFNHIFHVPVEYNAQIQDYIKFSRPSLTRPSPNLEKEKVTIDYGSTVYS